jgi:hypothetical protein
MPCFLTVERRCRQRGDRARIDPLPSPAGLFALSQETKPEMIAAYVVGADDVRFPLLLSCLETLRHARVPAPASAYVSRVS